MRNPPPATGWKRPLESFGKGLMFILKPLQVVSNFIFLGAAYVFGVGLSSLFYRFGPRRRARQASAPASWWRELPPAPRDKDAWSRPF
jgi:hypothetical protein